MQNFRPINAIAKGDILECDVAADCWQGRAPGLKATFSWGIENVAEPRH